MTRGRFADPSESLNVGDLDALYEEIFDNYLFETGGECTVDRNINLINLSVHNSQRLILNGFRAKRTENISTMSVLCGTTVAAPTPSLIRYGIYQRRADGINYDIVASTPHDATLFVAASTPYPKAFSASWKKFRGEDYCTAILIVSAAAMPSFYGIQNSTITALINQGIQTPIRAGIIGSQADLPATFAASSVTATNPLIFPQVILT